MGFDLYFRSLRRASGTRCCQQFGDRGRRAGTPKRTRDYQRRRRAMILVGVMGCQLKQARRYVEKICGIIRSVPYRRVRRPASKVRSGKLSSENRSRACRPEKDVRERDDHVSAARIWRAVAGHWSAVQKVMISGHCHARATVRSLAPGLWDD